MDLREIAKHFRFNWKETINEANEKEAGIDLKEVVQIFSCFSENDYKRIKWTKEINLAELKDDIAKIAFDMLNMSCNSLCK